MENTEQTQVMQEQPTVQEVLGQLVNVVNSHANELRKIYAILEQIVEVKDGVITLKEGLCGCSCHNEVEVVEDKEIQAATTI